VCGFSCGVGNVSVVSICVVSPSVISLSVISVGLVWNIVLLVCFVCV